jgi:hypothetical protein
MEKNWIVFDDGPAQASADEVYASMNKEGEIVINAHGFEQMGSPEAVVLMYEPDADLIGLKPASRLMPNAFGVRKKGPSGHRLIRAGSFVKRHDLRLDGTVRFRGAAVEDGVFVMCLRNLQNVKRKSASGQRDRGATRR